jgi:Skp family chaperone for outer membrane proteins
MRAFLCCFFPLLKHFLKIPLVGNTSAASFRVPPRKVGLRKAKALRAATEKSLKKLKKRLTEQSETLKSTPRKKRRERTKRKRSERRPKKIEEIRNSRLTDQNEPIQCTSRSEKRGCSKEHQFFQLLGLQIELNLVPTMNEAS